MRQIYTLTGLRGYAALWVVALHYTWDWQGTGFPMAIARMGGAGLTTFFVLSGFILSHVYADQLRDGLTRQAYWRFFWARFARVYPLHLLTLIVYAGIMGVGIIGSQGNEYFSTFLLNVLLLHAWGFTNELSWNQPSWSISTGFFAYLLFPFVIAMAMRGGPFVSPCFL